MNPQNKPQKKATSGNTWLITAQQKKSAAKTGMVLSLGALVATGLMRGRGARVLHTWSGMALIGFSAWHYNLYQPANREK